MNIEPTDEKAIYTVGSGKAAVWKTVPALFGYSKENAEKYRSFIRELITCNGYSWDYTNVICLKRDKYLIAAVLDESVNAEGYEINGLYADMFSPDFKNLEHKTLNAGENTLLCDLTAFKGSDKPQIVGTSVSISKLYEKDGAITLNFEGMKGVSAYIRLYVPYCVDCDATDVKCKYDKKSSTVLLSFTNRQNITLKRKEK